MMRILFFIMILNVTIFSNIAVADSSNEKQIINKEIKMIKSQSSNINQNVLRLALHAYHHAKKSKIVKNPYLTIIDYSLASNKKRLWVIDMKHKHVPFNTYVAHGKNSGLKKANHFSNKSGSLQSSLGVYLTKQPFIGGHVGYALFLKGLEKGFNDHAIQRGAVMHGAKYVNYNFIKHYGRAGRSWGCPALPSKVTKPIINKIKNGSVLVAYYPDRNWLSHSKYLV